MEDPEKELLENPEPEIKTEDPKTKKAPKPWYIQIVVFFLVCVFIVIGIPSLLSFIVCMGIVAIIPLCVWQICSFLKNISTQKRIKLTNGNYCRLQLRKLELKNDNK